MTQKRTVIAIMSIVASLVVGIIIIGFALSYSSPDYSNNNDQSVSQEESTNKEQQANSPKKIVIDREDDNEETIVLSQQTQKGVEDLKKSGAFWYTMSAYPGSYNSGTVVLFAKELDINAQDVVHVETFGGQEFTYTVVSTHPHVSPETSEWSVVGTQSFNRTVGEEQLVIMDSHEDTFDVTVLDPVGNDVVNLTDREKSYE